MNFDEYKNVIQYENFIIFEKYLNRVNSSDILLRGYQIYETLEDLIDILNRKSDLKYLVILNKLDRLKQMLNMIQNFENVAMTKFMNRIWTKYKKTSDLGDNFINLNLFLGVRPEISIPDIISSRLESENDVLDEMGDFNDIEQRLQTS